MANLLQQNQSRSSGENNLGFSGLTTPPGLGTDTAVEIGQGYKFGDPTGNRYQIGSRAHQVLQALSDASLPLRLQAHQALEAQILKAVTDAAQPESDAVADRPVISISDRSRVPSTDAPVISPIGLSLVADHVFDKVLFLNHVPFTDGYKQHSAALKWLRDEHYQLETTDEPVGLGSALSADDHRACAICEDRQPCNRMATCRICGRWCCKQQEEGYRECMIRINDQTECIECWEDIIYTFIRGRKDFDDFDKDEEKDDLCGIDKSLNSESLNDKSLNSESLNDESLNSGNTAQRLGV